MSNILLLIEIIHMNFNLIKNNFVIQVNHEKSPKLANRFINFFLKHINVTKLCIALITA